MRKPAALTRGHQVTLRVDAISKNMRPVPRVAVKTCRKLPACGEFKRVRTTRNADSLLSLPRKQFVLASRRLTSPFDARQTFQRVASGQSLCRRGAAKERRARPRPRGVSSRGHITAKVACDGVRPVRRAPLRLTREDEQALSEWVCAEAGIASCWTEGLKQALINSPRTLRMPVRSLLL